MWSNAVESILIISTTLRKTIKKDMYCEKKKTNKNHLQGIFGSKGKNN